MADDNLPESNDPPMKIFLCIQCHTHFARTEELVEMNLVRRVIFFPPLRCLLVVDPPEHHHLCQNQTTWLAPVRCRGCNVVMGCQIAREDNPNRPRQQGTVIIDMSLVLLWYGNHDHLFPLILLHVTALMQMQGRLSVPAPAPQPPSPASATDGHQTFSLMVPMSMAPHRSQLQLLLPTSAPLPTASRPILLLPALAQQPPSTTSVTNGGHRMSSLLVGTSMPSNPHQLYPLLPSPPLLLLAPVPQPSSPSSATNGHQMFFQMVRVSMPPHPYQPPLLQLLSQPPPPPPPPSPSLSPPPPSPPPSPPSSPMENPATNHANNTNGDPSG